MRLADILKLNGRLMENHMGQIDLQLHWMSEEILQKSESKEIYKRWQIIKAAMSLEQALHKQVRRRTTQHRMIDPWFLEMRQAKRCSPRAHTVSRVQNPRNQEGSLDIPPCHLLLPERGPRGEAKAEQFRVARPTTPLSSQQRVLLKSSQRSQYGTFNNWII